MKQFMQDAISAARAHSVETVTYSSFGWHDDGFVLGNKESHRTGRRPAMLNLPQTSPATSVCAARRRSGSRRSTPSTTARTPSPTSSSSVPPSAPAGAVGRVGYVAWHPHRPDG